MIAAAIAAITLQTARADARQALHVVSTPTQIHTECISITGQQDVCAASWASGDREYHGKVTIDRGGLPGCPVDTWKVRAQGRGRFLSPIRVHQDGRVIVPTRTAALGEPLRLYEPYEDTDQVDVTFSAPADPWTSADEFSAPDPGTHFVAFPATVTDSSSPARWNGDLSEARLVLAGGTELEPVAAVGCDDDDVDAGPGETRQLCVAFQVPDGAAWTQIQWATSAETGVWRP